MANARPEVTDPSAIHKETDEIQRQKPVQYLTKAARVAKLRAKLATLTPEMATLRGEFGKPDGSFGNPEPLGLATLGRHADTGEERDQKVKARAYFSPPPGC